MGLYRLAPKSCRNIQEKTLQVIYCEPPIKPSLCPCSSGKAWKDCCKPLIEGSQHALSAEQLMRSRYSAYATQAIDYLLDSTHPDTRDSQNRQDIKNWAETTHWRQLSIIKCTAGNGEKESGTVEFVASYLQNKQLEQHHELSHFKKHNGRWYFYEGQELPEMKIERNTPCPCGSGKKYKKCCGAMPLTNS